MDVVVCLDDADGMRFNHRRQSRDRVVIQRILTDAGARPLWMNAASAALFPADARVHVAEDFLAQAPENAVCFVEQPPLASVEARIRRLICYRWNRRYPADEYFDLPLALHGWRLREQEDFPGHSHELITREVYER